MDWNLKDLYPNINSKKISEDFLKLEKRSIKIDFNSLKKLDELNRDLIKKKEN